MRDLRVSRTIERVFGLALVWVSVALGAFGCGEPSTPDAVKTLDRCPGERGVLTEDKTACENAPSCGGRDADCLAGYTCVSDVCQPRISCTSDYQCGAGKCVKEACINPDTCTNDNECLAGDSCNKALKKCVESLCVGGCSRGECNEEQRKCISRSNCEKETEQSDCISGEYCLVKNRRGTCVSGSAFCDSLGCEKLPAGRGVCSFEKKACVNKASCETDRECLVGYYCRAESATCERSTCSTEKEGCDTGGVCDPVGGGCKNREPCTKADDCVAGQYCMKDEKTNLGVCKEDIKSICEQKCGRELVCAYEPEILNVSCKEQLPCTTSLNCAEEKMCRDRKCVVLPTNAPCVDDKYSPHSATPLTAIDFKKVQVSNKVSKLVLCPAITPENKPQDYIYISDRISNGKGVSVKVEIEKEDIGLGIVEAEIIRVSGSSSISLKSAKSYDEKTKKHSSEIALLYKEEGDAITNSKYYVKVHSNNLSSVGVRYSVSINIINPEIQTFCETAKPITLGTSVEGEVVYDETQEQRLTETSCSAPDQRIKDALYTFELLTESYVKFSLETKNNTVDLMRAVIALRKDCVDEKSEIEKSCVQAKAAGEKVEYESVLKAGRYTLFVTVESGKKGGAFRLTTSAQNVACEANHSKCLTGAPNSVEICNDEGKLETVECPNGAPCDTTRNVCSTGEGTQCFYPILVDTDHSYNKAVDFSKQLSTSNPTTSCSDVAHADGPDQHFQVKVPAGGFFIASIGKPTETSPTANYSLYMFSDCAQTESCTAEHYADSAKDGETEKLRWDNKSDKEVTWYLVADMEKQVTTYPTAMVKVNVYAKEVCKPNTTDCKAYSTMRLCNDDGTGYVLPHRLCTSGCDKEGVACKPPEGDSCKSDTFPVLDLAGTLQEYDLGTATDAIATPAKSCGTLGNGSATGNKELVFQVEMKKYDRVTVRALPTDIEEDLMIWMVDPGTDLKSCGATDTDAQCIDAVNKNGPGSAEEFFFFAKEAGTYHFVVETAIGSTPGYRAGKIKVGIKKEAKECDSPNTILGCINTRYISNCSPTATNDIVYDCGANGCINGKNVCTSQTGLTLYDPLVLTGSNNTFKFGGTFPNGKVVPFGKDEMQGSVGNCIFDDDAFSGNDMYYKVNLQPGETISLDVSHSSAYSYDKVRVFFLENCGTFEPNCTHRYQFTRKFPILDAYTNTGTQPTDVCFGLGARYSWSNDFTVKWKKENKATTGYVCSPGHVRCEDPTTQKVCNNDGKGETTYTCAEGCDHGYCKVTFGFAGTCSTVPPVLISSLKAGQTMGGIYHYKSASGGFTRSDVRYLCVGATTKSGKHYVKVEAKAGQVITATGSSIEESNQVAVFIASDCNYLNSSCLAGAFSSSNGTVAEAKYYVAKDGEYIIGSDDNSWGSWDEHGRVLKIDVSTAVCQKGTFKCSDDKSDRLYCDGFKWVSIPCANGSTCSGGLCQPAQGQTCSEPIEIDTSTDKTGTISGNLKDIVASWSGLAFVRDETSVDGCFWSARPDGPEKYYSIALAAGETLEAKIETATGSEAKSITLYLLDKCVNAGGKCLVNDPETKETVANAPRSLSFTSKKGGTYLLVVDSASTAAIGKDLTYELKYDIKPPSTGTKVCVPFSSYCDTDDATHKKIFLCNEDGDAYIEGSCSGSCVGTRCTQDQSATSTCADVTQEEVTASFSVVLEPGSLPAEKTSSVGASQCTGISTADRSAGGELVYKIRLQPRSKLIVRARSSKSKDKSYAYLTKTCIADTTCLLGGYQNHANTSSTLNVLEYVAGAKEESYYLWLDTASAQQSAMLFTVEIIPPACNYGDDPVCDSDKEHLKFCTLAGRYDKYKCPAATGGGDACPSSANACANPSGNRCLDAIPVTITAGSTNPTQVTGTFAGRENTYDGKGSLSCTGSSTPGNDVVYKVVVPAGKTLTVTGLSKAATPDDIALYVAADCDAINTGRCLAGVDDKALTNNDKAESLSYTNVLGSDKVFYVIVDSHFESLTSVFELNFSLN